MFPTAAAMSSEPTTRSPTKLAAAGKATRNALITDDDEETDSSAGSAGMAAVQMAMAAHAAGRPMGSPGSMMPQHQQQHSSIGTLAQTSTTASPAMAATQPWQMSHYPATSGGAVMGMVIPSGSPSGNAGGWNSGAFPNTPKSQPTSTIMREDDYATISGNRPIIKATSMASGIAPDPLMGAFLGHGTDNNATSFYVRTDALKRNPSNRRNESSFYPQPDARASARSRSASPAVTHGTTQSSSPILMSQQQEDFAAATMAMSAPGVDSNNDDDDDHQPIAMGTAMMGVGAPIAMGQLMEVSERYEADSHAGDRGYGRDSYSYPLHKDDERSMDQDQVDYHHYHHRQSIVSNGGAGSEHAHTTYRWSSNESLDVATYGDGGGGGGGGGGERTTMTATPNSEEGSISPFHNSFQSTTGTSDDEGGDSVVDQAVFRARRSMRAMQHSESLLANLMPEDAMPPPLMSISMPPPQGKQQQTRPVPAIEVPPLRILHGSRRWQTDRSIGSLQEEERVPDLVTGISVVGRSLTWIPPFDQHVVICETCRDPLMIAKVAVLVQCPTCGDVSPANSKRNQKHHQ